MAEEIATLFSTPAMLATFSPRMHVRCMLRFESALAQAEARAGIIPAEAAQAITSACHDDASFDVATLYHEAITAGTPAIPLVRMLTEHVAGAGQKFVHWGATSQDAIDTAMMLQMRDGIDLLLKDLFASADACKALVEQHWKTPMIGRTLLQQALPITFGLKAARWLALVCRQIQALRERRERDLVVQVGGATGTLASLGAKGLQVMTLLAEELKLAVPDLPWHTERDRIGEIASTLGVIAGSMAKIAHDIVLLAQTEIGEATEGHVAGKGGSSAMPQKRNPVDATRALGAARLATGTIPVILNALVQEHERAVGGWQSEWVAIPDLFRFTSGAVDGVKSAVTTLHIDPARMQSNLDLTHGLVMSESLTMALAAHMGRADAYRLVQDLCNRVMASGEDLHQLVREDQNVRALLSAQEIDQALDPTRYLGSTDVFIERALEVYQQIQFKS